jgi:hypothetical protein
MPPSVAATVAIVTSAAVTRRARLDLDLDFNITVRLYGPAQLT